MSHLRLGVDPVLSSVVSLAAWLSEAQSPIGTETLGSTSTVVEDSPLHSSPGDLIPPYASRRQDYKSGFISPRELATIDGSYEDKSLASLNESFRTHPLYKDPRPAFDGFFHCPWEGQADCHHRPNKLKCNYSKFVDAHLKPFRCSNASCDGPPFSSAACLLRHEREAHAMHGHGDKPFHCSYESCDRSAPGNGFPREWNLRDHVRRVHHEQHRPARGRKRKAAVQAPVPDSGTWTETSLKDWESHRESLQRIVVSLHTPDHKNSQGLLLESQGHLQAMRALSLGVGLRRGRKTKRRS
ncbi:hypothetical protein EV126DRAFT_424247 [Verticillium dahliae]|nr:hypothetical protein EV126DRAFT_424247 [Verticillium dahliae]